MRIHITGASCAGVTTLGHALASSLSLRHFDVDDFYWLPTNPPFTTKRAPEERVALIQQRFGDDNWVLTGSCAEWGDALIKNADLIVFVATPTSVRLERLAAREKQRYGNRLEPGGDVHQIHVAFKEWASRYDDPTFSGRNRARHALWLSKQTVPIVRVDGLSSAEKMAADVIHALSQVAPWLATGKPPLRGNIR
ncbi:AAA family ATPase [Pseudomonas palleroniana]|uniref:Adenylate kinase n=1 Tax=Pseudomonas palleroniana TaxID=191390 RepID=A0A2L1J6I4_9PSED|nr:AAA family ATPase [Pseudomonas palleroniana]AVE04070.1 adenylate kinase [Pseudomonas palleroniana]UOP10571.1 AAA family ATPase [Pseudomonas palleroniana]